MKPDQPFKLKFSGALQRLASKEPRRYYARYVKAGPVKAANSQPSGICIDPQALSLAAAAGLFENKAVFIDHAGFFEYPSLNNLVGGTANTLFNAAEQSIQGEIRTFETPAGKLAETIIDELLEAPGDAPDVGLSIVFYPQWNEAYDTIVSIKHVESVDLVFQPAAEGRIIAALNGSNIAALNGSNIAALNGSHIAPLNGSYIAALNGSYIAALSASQPTQSPRKETPIMTETTVPPTEPTAAAPAAPEAWAQSAAQAARRAILSSSGLPQAARERLSLGDYAHPDELTAAIEQERRYLAQLSQDGVIQIGGEPPRSPHITGMMTSVDKVQLALEAMLTGTRPRADIPPLYGIRELYHLLSGDYEMSGVFQAERIQLANVNSSTMASMVANALNKLVVQEFVEYPRWWEPFASLVDFDSLQAVRWSVLGGVGELPTVAEGAAYTELTWDDKYESSSFIKKGGYLGLTMEAIDKDDTGRLRNAPRALAQAAWLTLSKSVSSIFTASSGVGPTLIDAKALFHTDHANLGTTALSLAAYTAIRTAMRKQTELNSGERLGALCAPKFLLVPPDLEITALQILASEYDYTYALSNAPAAPQNALAEGNDLQARMNFARARVIVVDLWTDTNDYACVADPRLYPSIGVGFRYGRQPEIFSVASPTAGLMFTNDTLPIKVRFVYAAGPIDYRGLYKANVA